MIGTSVTKELTTRNNKFITNQKEVKKENKFSRSRNFDFTCWLEKPIWLINTKFCEIQTCSINTEAGVPRWSVKMVLLTVSQNSQESISVGVIYLKSSRLLVD